MRAAGIGHYEGAVEPIELWLGRLRPDEVLIDVRCCGVGNWDDVIRAGHWDVGQRPPMALGVELAGVVSAVGERVTTFAAGDEVMTHSAPLRQHGAWAEQFVAAAADVAHKPAGVSFEAAAAAPIPVLTADQVLRDALGVTAGAALLVHGAGGVTGTVIVQLAIHLGAEVIATAGARSTERLAALGAAHVLDHRAPAWPDQVRRITGGTGADFAVNAVPGGSAGALALVRDGGRLAVITSDVPVAERGVDVRQVFVAPDGPRLTRLAALLADGTLDIGIAAIFSLEDAADAMERVRQGTDGRAVVLQPGLSRVTPRFASRPESSARVTE